MCSTFGFKYGTFVNAVKKQDKIFEIAINCPIKVKSFLDCSLSSIFPSEKIYFPKFKCSNIRFVKSNFKQKNIKKYILGYLV